jgi:hypothetical protein
MPLPSCKLLEVIHIYHKDTPLDDVHQVIPTGIAGPVTPGADPINDPTVGEMVVTRVEPTERPLDKDLVLLQKLVMPFVPVNSCILIASECSPERLRRDLHGPDPSKLGPAEISKFGRYGFVGIS